MSDLPTKDELDYNLGSCFEYNVIAGFSHRQIRTDIAIWEGERDMSDWRWVLALHSGQYMYLRAGCDYTGWDCRSWITSHQITDTPEDAAMVEPEELIRQSLMEQVTNGKETAWREKTDKALGISEVRPDDDAG